MHKNALSYISIITVLFFAVTTLYTAYYYDSFGINIFQHATFDEIFIQGIVPFIWILFSLLFSAFLLFILHLIFILIDITSSQLKPNTKKKNFVTINFIKSFLTFVVYFIISLALTVYIDKGAGAPDHIKYNLISLSLPLACVILFSSFPLIKIKNATFINRTNIVLASACIILLVPFITLNIAYSDYIDRLHDNGFILETNTINQCLFPPEVKHVRYIGATKQIVFFTALTNSSTFPILRNRIFRLSIMTR